ncbi:MAG: EamA family transporter [Williamsia sp.]|nr:EamA family transporter [Williamsia sp.]
MWIIFSLMAALATGIVVTLSKNGIKNVDPLLGFAIESVLIIIVAWGVTIGRGKLSGIGEIDRRSWIFLIAAGIITCLSSLCSFQALKLGEASRTSSLERASLVFSVLFAVLFLKERINWQVIVGAILMTAGAVIIAFSRKA